MKENDNIVEYQGPSSRPVFYKPALFCFLLAFEPEIIFFSSLVVPGLSGLFDGKMAFYAYLVVLWIFPIAILLWALLLSRWLRKNQLSHDGDWASDVAAIISAFNIALIAILQISAKVGYD